MKYVALLRGINVGGNKAVNMAQLKAMFEQNGYANVSTYINSGNVIFEAKKDAQTIVPTIEKAIERTFGFEVPVIVRSADQIHALAKLIPDDWQNNQEHKTDILFLWQKVDKAEVLDELPARAEIDNVRYTPGAVIWYVKRSDINKSGMNKLIGTELYRNMTIRNVNTVRKLVQLLQD